MYHLDNGSGIDTMPNLKNKQSDSVKWFTEGDNINPPSYPGQDWFNVTQAELLNVLKAAGITPQKAQLNQLAESIQKIVNNSKAPNASITTAGIVQLSSAIDSDSEKTAATSKAVKTSYTLASNALPKSGGIVTGDSNFMGKLQQSGIDVLTKETGSGRLINVVKFEKTGSYRPTDGTRFIIVEVCGAGGAGGGAGVTMKNYSSLGSGGGAGGYCQSLIKINNLSPLVNITIGAGGVGVSENNGTNGGTSSFGSILIANGGVGGVKAGQANSSFGVQGGVGGDATGGSLFNFSGEHGNDGFTVIPAFTFAGGGANSKFGSGGQGGSASHGYRASGYGAGGGGCEVSGGQVGVYAGGNGANGLVVVWEYA